jgi:hypothetical protein
MIVGNDEQKLVCFKENLETVNRIDFLAACFAKKLKKRVTRTDLLSKLIHDGLPALELLLEDEMLQSVTMSVEQNAVEILPIIMRLGIKSYKESQVGVA